MEMAQILKAIFIPVYENIFYIAGIIAILSGIIIIIKNIFKSKKIIGGIIVLIAGVILVIFKENISFILFNIFKIK